MKTGDRAARADAKPTLFALISPTSLSVHQCLLLLGCKRRETQKEPNFLNAPSFSKCSLGAKPCGSYTPFVKFVSNSSKLKCSNNFS